LKIGIKVVEIGEFGMDKAMVTDLFMKYLTTHSMFFLRF